MGEGAGGQAAQRTRTRKVGAKLEVAAIIPLGSMRMCVTAGSTPLVLGDGEYTSLALP